MEDMTAFDYAEFTTRNLGFLTPAEQAALREGAVFVAGVGGMGGACFLALVRAGVGRFAVCDIDVFETSNLNRQVFAFTDTVGQDKAEAACAPRVASTRTSRSNAWGRNGSIRSPTSPPAIG